MRLTETLVPISSFEGVWLWSYESSSTFDHNYTLLAFRQKKVGKKDLADWKVAGTNEMSANKVFYFILFWLNANRV